MNVPTFEGNYFFLDKENAMSSMTPPERTSSTT